MDDKKDKNSGFQILDPEVDLKISEEKKENVKSQGAKATSAREEALSYKSETEMPLREQLAIVAAFMALVYFLVLLFEHSATFKYDPGTSHRPGVNESIVPNRDLGGSPRKAPW
jgi:hypothetical protein